LIFLIRFSSYFCFQVLLNFVSQLFQMPDIRI